MILTGSLYREINERSQVVECVAQVRRASLGNATWKAQPWWHRAHTPPVGTGGSQSPRILPISLPTVLLSLKHLACCTGTSELSDPALTGMAAVQTPVLSRMFYCSVIEIGLHQVPPPPENCQDWWLVLTSVLRTCSCWRVRSTFLLYPNLSVHPWRVQFALRLLKNINKHLQERQCWNFLTRHIKLLYRHKMIVSEPKEYIQSWNLIWEASGIFF